LFLIMACPETYFVSDHGLPRNLLCFWSWLVQKPTLFLIMTCPEIYFVPDYGLKQYFKKQHNCALFTFNVFFHRHQSL